MYGNDVSAQPLRSGSIGNELPEGTIIHHGQYKIGPFLNAGGFGITYLARNSLGRSVVIKECFPSTMCLREGKEVRVRSPQYQKSYQSLVAMFRQEAVGLSRLDHPNIVGVHEVFRDNNTAYMALDYVRGRDLLEIAADTTERLGNYEIRSILVKVLEAVRYIHSQGILHRDISPDNILMDRANGPILIDFGSASAAAARQSSSYTAMKAVKDGYSPFEFYTADQVHSASSDLYALAATFYHLISGSPPPPSHDRLAAVAEGRPDPLRPLRMLGTSLDDRFSDAIDRCLSIFSKDRIQTARDWILEIDEKKREQIARERLRDDVAMSERVRNVVEETNRDISSRAETSTANRTCREPTIGGNEKTDQNWSSKFRATLPPEIDADGRKELPSIQFTKPEDLSTGAKKKETLEVTPEESTALEPSQVNCDEEMRISGKKGMFRFW